MRSSSAWAAATWRGSIRSCWRPLTPIGTNGTYGSRARSWPTGRRGVTSWTKHMGSCSISFPGPESRRDVLRALWALNAIGGTDRGLLIKLAGHDHEAVRAWAIRLLTDAWPLDDINSRRPVPTPEPDPDSEVFALLVRRAREDRSGLVRLVLASTLQRLPVARRAELAAPLLGHAEDAADHDLPLLAWYGLIPLGELDPTALERLAEDCAPADHPPPDRASAGRVDRPSGAGRGCGPFDWLPVEDGARPRFGRSAGGSGRRAARASPGAPAVGMGSAGRPVRGEPRSRPH